MTSGLEEVVLCVGKQGVVLLNFVRTFYRRNFVRTSYEVVGVLLKYSYEVFLYEFVKLRRFSTKGKYLSYIFVGVMADI